MNFGMDNSGARAYTDNPTLGNNFYYRESEAHAKVTADALHLRDNDEIGPRLFTDVHQELCYCEEYQKKTYTSD